MVTVVPIDSYTQLLKRRLHAVRSLTEVLEDSHNALLSRNLESLQHLTQQQQTLCGEIEFLDRDLRSADDLLEWAGSPPPDSADIGQFKKELSVAEAELVHSYKVHAALLRRARRTVNVMINVATSESNAYCSPSSYQSLQATEEE